MKLLVAAAALAVALVPGAGAQTERPLTLDSGGPAVISPNGNGVHDVYHLRVSARPGSELELRAYAWGGRLLGWRQLQTDVTAQAVAGHAVIAWDGTTATGHHVGDGTYLVTACYEDPGSPQAPVIPPAKQRPGAAEASVSRPPWHFSGCLGEPQALRVERIAAFVDATRSFTPGTRVPLTVSADEGKATTELEQDCSGYLTPGLSLPRGLSSGLYHFVVSDPWGDRFVAPVVVRNPTFPIDHPPPHTALLVWPYLTWRAYNAYDANVNGIPDSWYQFWRQRRVSLKGPLLRGGLEDDHRAAAPFSRWLCARNPRVESITDVELGRLSPETLRRYRMVVFPGHTEYYEPKTYDLLRRYRDEGGRLVFLLANPFYRQVRLDPARNAVEMTDFDAREGRSDLALAGVGYDGCCFPRVRASRYVAAGRREFARVRWLFRGTGIQPGQPFGYAGSESDRVDPELTPHDHVVAGRAVMAGKHGVVNAALVWSRAGRGEVLATGNYDFLRMRRSLTWTLLDNVWRRFSG